MFRNGAGQSFTVFAMNSETGQPVPGDAANITVSVKVDGAAVVDISGSPTEDDATKAKGNYSITPTQANTNGRKLVVSGRSSTANVVIVGETIYPEGVWFGTLSAISPTAITLPAGHLLDIQGSYSVRLQSGTNAFGKSRFLVYSGAGDVWTVDPAWNVGGNTTPSGTITALLLNAEPSPTSSLPPVDVRSLGGTTQTPRDIGLFIDAAMSSRMATYAQPAGFLAATFPTDPADQSLVIAATTAIVNAITALNNLSSAQAQAANAAALTAYGVPTSAQLIALLGTADDAVLTAIGNLNNLSSLGAQAAAAAALAAYGAVTNTQMTNALATADDAVLTAIGNLNNLSSLGAQAAAAAALAAYSAATGTQVANVPAALMTAAQATPIHAKVRIINETPLQGSGTPGDLMRPA